MAQLHGVWRRRCGIGMVVSAVGLMAFGATQARAEVTGKEVDAAVDKAVAHLLSLQQADGSWEADAMPAKGKKGKKKGDRANQNYGGETAIATYALLAAGQKPNSPPLKKAIEWLQSAELRGTYAVGLRAQVWHLIPSTSRSFFGTGKIESARDYDRDWIVASRIQKGTNKGFYGYVYGNAEEENESLAAATLAAGGKRPAIDPAGPKQDAWYDRSNSQYGVLGAWALEQAGAEIPTTYWAEEDAAWKKAQSPTGGWNYRGEDDGDRQITPTMTAAGIATLYITQDYVMRANAHQFDTCRGGMSNPNIDKGLAWMDKHIAAAMAKPGGFHYYFLYGIERIGVASGRKYFGTVDWYKSGAEAIVRSQEGNGSWGEVHNTCFSLLFLVRGRAPVMMNKLIYETASKKQVDPWNERPRDAANLSHWMGEHALDNTILNWQAVNLKVDVDELHDAPILYIAGSTELSLSEQDTDKLRQFVEQGGMIVGNADCGSAAFSKSFWKLGNKMFPKYESRKLPPTHLVYDEMFHGAKWRAHPTVEGLSNGVREMMMLIPEADAGRAWQTESTKIREECYQLAANIFLYATGKENLFEKGETYIVHAQGEGGHEVKVARIEAGDNWNPEPGAWPRLSAYLHNTRHVDVKTDSVKLGSAGLGGFKIAALTGTAKLVLSDPQRQELKSFVDGGGTLIIDAAGGSAEFATSIEEEMKKIFGAAADKAMTSVLPATAPIYTDPAGKIEHLGYRSFARHALTGSMREGRIRGIEVAGGRIGVFFSREDLTAGCVGQQVDGIVGYNPETATQLMANIVMYAANGGSGATADAK